ncbi:MAG: hypothetical protein ABSG35_20375 [Syntrophobacteraceae bacterium]
MGDRRECGLRASSPLPITEGPFLFAGVRGKSSFVKEIGVMCKKDSILTMSKSKYVLV